MLCQKCQENAGKAYSFYAGRKEGQTVQDFGTERVTKSYFGGIEEKEAYLCKKCARRNSTDWLKMFGFFILFAGLVYLSYVLFSLPSDGIEKSAGFCSGLIAVLMFLFFLAEVELSAKTLGENKAIALMREELKQQGYDSFWNTKAYQKLKKD